MDSKNESVYSMSVVRKKTDLSERKIRYYEEQGLVVPYRTAGNHRLFSDSDVTRLLEIKKWLGNGKSIAEIQKKFRERGWITPQNGELKNEMELSDAKIHSLLRKEISKESQFGRKSNSNPFFR